jgi:ABC-type sulfate/molybdate transport systems ATPase subunit
VADLKDLLPATGITTVFSSHSENDVRKLADRQVELEGGRIRLARP